MFKEAVFNTLGGAAKLLVSFISVPILLHFMGASHYGIWILLFSFTSILTLFDGGIGLSVVYFLANRMPKNEGFVIEIFNKYLSSLLFTILFLCVLLVLFFFMFINPIETYFASKINESIEFKRVLFFLLGSSIILILQQFIYGILQAVLDYKYLNLHKSIGSIIQQICIIAVVISGKSYFEMSFIVFITNLIFIIISFYYVKKYIPVGFFLIFNKKNISEIFKYSSKVWVGYFGNSLFLQADKFIVASSLSINNVGIYGAITSLLAYINMASSTPIRSLISHSAISKSDNSTIRDKFAQSISLNFIVAFCTSIFLLTYLANLKLIENNFIGNIVIFFSVIIYFLYSLNAPGYFYLLGSGKVFFTTKLILIGGSISLIFIFILGKLFGLYGCLLGNAGFIITIYLTIISKKELKIKLNISKLIFFNTFLIFIQAVFIYFHVSSILEWILAVTLIMINIKLNHYNIFSNLLIFTRNVITR